MNRYDEKKGGVVYRPKISSDLIPRLCQLAKAHGLPMTHLVNQLVTEGINRLEGKAEEPGEPAGSPASRLQVKRWLRALGIAKILFEEEGYHTIYLNEIEQCIVARQPIPHTAEDREGPRRPRRKRKEP